MKKPKNIGIIIYGLVMMFVFILMCSYAENGKFAGALITLAILMLMAIGLNIIFPQDPRDDKV